MIMTYSPPLRDKTLATDNYKIFFDFQNIFDYFLPCIQRIKINFISPAGQQLGLTNLKTKDSKDLKIESIEFS